ncbi:MAG: AraC family transcriptional regulator [Rhodobacteraceae bacterium]|nr:MAG: AraC family transcriptional regulator [Paracoccaceae bacterium]
MENSQPVLRREPLAAFPLFGTREVDVARDVVGRTFCPHRLEIPQHALPRFATRHNHVAGEFLSLNHLSYGAEVEIDPGLLEHFYLVQIPLEGGADITNGGRSFCADRQVGSILNPSLPTRMIWGDGCRKLLVQIRRDALSELVEVMLGARLETPLVFDPRLDLSRPGPHAWLRLLTRCVQAAEARRAFGASGYRFQRVIEEELALALVQAQPSSITHFLESPCARAAHATHIRKARSFIHDHIAEPFRMRDLTRAAGCSLRSLQIGFQTAFQVTPQQYAIRARLDRAHSRLQFATPAESVASIAHDCGFTHMGRFAQTYQEVYGQPPSATLRTGKAESFDAAGLRSDSDTQH